MKNIIGAVVVIVCIVAGAIGGNILRVGGGGGGPSAESHDDGHGGDAHGDETHAKAEKKKKDSHGGEEASTGGVAYFKFSREFVVPIMQDGRVKSLVILNINLEADAKASQELFSMEPKLRDNIMTTLVRLSSDGKTMENLTDPESYETIRSVVLLNLQDVVSHGIKNVLILDMAVQDL